MAARRALVVASYEYADPGLRRLTAPAHDAEALAAVLADPEIAGFEVTTLRNQPHHVVGEAIADLYGRARREDLTLLYFTGHGVKDDEGRLHLAMTNTRRDALSFTAISASQLDDAMDTSPSRRKVLVLDCCYSGAFPPGRTAKADEGVQTLERFQGRGRAVLTASDATQYAFEGDEIQGSAPSSVFTRYLVEGLRTGAADLDEDGDIALDELYSWVRDKVVAETPQQRPKKQEDVDGRLVLARNVRWTLPAYLRHAVDSPLAAQRLGAVQELEHLHVSGNEMVRAAVAREIQTLSEDDSRSVSAAASDAAARMGSGAAPPEEAPEPVREPVRERVREPAPVPIPTSTSRPAVAASAEGAPPGSAGRRAPGLLPLALVAGAAVLLVVSRFEVFEPVNGYHAVDLGWSTPNWIVQAALPLVVALVLLSPGWSSAAVRALGSGVAAGVALNLGSQVAMSAIVTLDDDVGYAVGPAWWTILVAGLLLAVAVAVMPRATRRGPLAVRRDGRAMAGGALVVLSAAGWVLVGPVSVDFGWWLYLDLAGALLTGACLAVALLRLGPGARLFGLAAVTVTGTWLAATGVEGLVGRSEGSQPGAIAMLVVVAVVAVLGAYVGQLRRPEGALAAAGA